MVQIIVKGGTVTYSTTVEALAYLLSAGYRTVGTPVVHGSPAYKATLKRAITQRNADLHR